MISDQKIDINFLSQLWERVINKTPTERELGLLKTYLNDTVNRLKSFKKISLPTGYGFDPFSEEDIILFLSAASQWNLSFNKEKGKGILYGRRHARLRQGFVNTLPDKLRKELLFQKIQSVSLFGSLDRDDVIDISDIGMGNSVYRIQYQDVHGEVKDRVVKKEELLSQAFMTQLLDLMGWATYHSGHWVGQSGGWEISDYISDTNLQDILNQAELTESLVIQLGRQASLGDIVGRGDRHTENYMVKEGELRPIDISYLFREDNDVWLERYIAGGLAEFSVVVVESKERQREFDSLFWKSYEETLAELIKRKEAVIALVESYFGVKDQGTKRKVQFIENRLNDSKFISKQKKRYERSRRQLVQKIPLKRQLDEMLKNDNHQLNKQPWLKMYALANEGRVGSFYLMEEFHPDLLERIKEF